ncbi:MAG: hypothetical protein RIC89_19430 [Pseudomonadales bacterium]
MLRPHRFFTLLQIALTMCVALLSANAFAFKIHTHVWIADQLADEIINSEGHVSIHGRNYALHPQVAQAITTNRGAFVMGTLGADMYPDMFAGQMTTHPGVNPDGRGAGWQTDDWLNHVLQAAFATNKAGDIAFAAGYLLHAAMDTWAHSYVNLYTGDLFMILENSEIAERHVALESYMAKFHRDLRHKYANSPQSDVYTQMQAPVEFIRNTLILNSDAAREYARDLSTGTVYYSAIYAYYRAAQEAREDANGLANLLNSELHRLDPLLNQLPVLKARVDSAQEDFDKNLMRLSQAAHSVLDGISNVMNSTGIEAALEANGVHIDLDAPAIAAKTALDKAFESYQQVTDQIGYSVAGAYDPDVIRGILQQGVALSANGVVGQWPTNIERAVDAWIRAWEETGKEIMRPHGLPGRNPMEPMTQWMQCWAPLLLHPMPGAVSAGCDFTLSTISDISTEIAVAEQALTQMLPHGHTILLTMEALRAGAEEAIQNHATNALNAIGQVVSQEAIANTHGSLPSDPTGLATWMVRMWDKNTTIPDLDRAFTTTNAIKPYFARRVSPAIHRELGICENPALKASTYDDPPFKDYAPIQNAVMMSKLALLDATGLNSVIRNKMLPDSPSRMSSNRPNLPGADRNSRMRNAGPYLSTLPMGAALIGAIRSIDGDHQWMPTAPPLPRVNQNFSGQESSCRRNGYPASNTYEGACAEGISASRLAKKPGFILFRDPYREPVFNALFRPLAPELCAFTGHDIESCPYNDAFAAYAVATPQDRGNGLQKQSRTPQKQNRKPPGTRAARTTLNKRQTQAPQKAAVSRQSVPRTASSTSAAQRTTKRPESRAAPQRPAPRDASSRTTTKQPARVAQQRKPARKAPERNDTARSFLDFDGNAVNLDWRNSYLLSLLSYVSYPGVTGPGAVDESALYSQLRRWDLEPVAWRDITTHGIDSGSTQFLAATTEDALIIAFRGSTMSMSDLGQDWLDNDLDMHPQTRTEWGRGVVLHDGFIDAAKIAFPVVGDVIKQHGQRRDGSPRKIWMTGHSLGGAVAVLSAMYVETEMRQNVAGVYIYGAPPVGNARWAGLYNAAVPNTHRFSIQYDPVTAMMMQLPATPFRHVGKRHNLLESKTLPNDSRELAYPPQRGAGHLLADLNSTHLGYWCRLNQEVTSREVPGMPEPPRANCNNLCAW